MPTFRENNGLNFSKKKRRPRLLEDDFCMVLRGANIPRKNSLNFLYVLFSKFRTGNHRYLVPRGSGNSGSLRKLNKFFPSDSTQKAESHLAIWNFAPWSDKSEFGAPNREAKSDWASDNKIKTPTSARPGSVDPEAVTGPNGAQPSVCGIIEIPQWPGNPRPTGTQTFWKNP